MKRCVWANIHRVCHDVTVGQKQGQKTALKERYNDAGQVLTETNVGGMLAGVLVSRSYRPEGPLETLASRRATETFKVSYGYDGAGRLRSVGWGNPTTPDFSATYTYEPHSSLVKTLTFAAAANPNLNRASSWQSDRLNRLQWISASGVPAFSCGDNHANQHTRMDREDGTHWEYGGYRSVSAPNSSGPWFTTNTEWVTKLSTGSVLQERKLEFSWMSQASVS